MKQLVTTAIILSRTDYGEADRIITVLTPDHGKLRLMARGVRRVKSKLAGGIELFSVSTITFIRGKGDIGTLVSTRLLNHYGHIVDNLERTMLGYELIKQLNKITEDEPEPVYFELLQQVFGALDDPTIPLPLIRFWFIAQLLRIGGRQPNLRTDDQGSKLDASARYKFNLERMAFTPSSEHGQFGADTIKFLRLTFGSNIPKTLQQVQGSDRLTKETAPLVFSMFQP
ncbi:MAG TPA: DNA repair protein RecO [Nevskiaceae bacterium]|nr:DNA repair protein RecO [Nevskiaceae bacterium]